MQMDSRCRNLNLNLELGVGLKTLNLNLIPNKSRTVVSNNDISQVVTAPSGVEEAGLQV
jgi:hypothetical protein